MTFIWLRSPDLAMERVRERVLDGGHNIPEEVVRRRYRRGAQNFFRLYQEIADSWGVLDNSLIAQPRLIAAGRGRQQERIYLADVWEEFREIANEKKT